MSSTAVQRTTEKTGERIPDDPAELIDPGEHGQPCPLMVVEVDGTTSPQISPQPGVTGRESLRAQTCFKECTDSSVTDAAQLAVAYRFIP